MSEIIKNEIDQMIEYYKQKRIEELNARCLRQPIDKKTYYKRLNKL